MKLTPGMQQYMEIKNQNPDALCLFRMGDFYETFFEDAKVIAKELNIVLTARGKDESRAPLAGIPYHALDGYLSKLVRKGYKVAIVEQLEDPKKAKGLVKRGVVRIVTPGTVIEGSMLDERSNNYIFSVIKDKEAFGIAIADMSTGEFLVSEAVDIQKLFSELSRFAPKEVLIPMSQERSQWADAIRNIGISLSGYDDRHYWDRKAKSTLLDHFGVMSLEGYGIEGDCPMVYAAGALLSYLMETQMTAMDHIRSIKRFNDRDYMILDSSTQRNLELLKNIHDGSQRGALISVIDRTLTPMGSRMLKRWLLRPLLDIQEIEKRHKAVGELCTRTMMRETLREQQLKHIQDIERLIGRISYGAANARDLIALKRSLEHIPSIISELADSESGLLKTLSAMDDLSSVQSMIAESIEEEPPLSLREGNIIKANYDGELKEIRKMSRDGKSYIAELEEKEKERTGIKSLKIRYNRIFGYFIEVTKANAHLVPEHYIRKQTQVNSERYITDELKQKEELILGAEERMAEKEYELFQQIIKKIAESTQLVQETAESIAALDVLCSLARIAIDNSYIRPVFNSEGSVHILDSRHPVLERIEDIYIPNDIIIDRDNFIQIITGPNMAGKSSYMRQAALIFIMAQTGSFIPASSASLSIVDRVFTRVGAYDDLTMGQSTFMVEMNETANILNNATSDSFIVLDEIGRGTSTYDGVSLAWSIAEYIHDRIGAKTLFATHYHQMNKLAQKLPGIRNYNIAVKEKDDEIIFLRKIVEGGTDRSYGIQVAKLAGVPKEVIERSKVIMNRLEMEDEIGERIHSDLKPVKAFPDEKQDAQVAGLEYNQKKRSSKTKPQSQAAQNHTKQLSLFDI